MLSGRVFSSFNAAFLGVTPGAFEEELLALSPAEPA
jgi:hypothetical protein